MTVRESRWQRNGILERVTFSMPTVSFEEEKIKRASILVLPCYRKIRTLTMVIR